MLQGFQNIILAIKDWANGKFQPSGNYALVENSGYSLGLNIDSDYVMTIELKNASGNVLSTKSIDFPIESMVVNASYADGELTLTLQNGQELTVDISSVVNGLVNDTFTIAGINMKDDITKEELASALGVPTKISDLENDSNFLTKTGDASNTTVTFEQAAQRANVQSGDDLATAFAKLSKYCADLKAVAFSGAYGDLTGTPQSLKNPNALTFTGAVTGSYDGSAEESVAIPSITNNLLSTDAGTALDAVQGKALDDKINNLNPLKQFYDVGISGNIDSHIDSLAFLQEHPGGIFGHSVALQHIVGNWVNIISYGARIYGQVSQVAFGVRGTAVRYLSHETNKWSEWVPFNNLLIDRINNGLPRFKDVNHNLGNIEWSQSAAGMYFATFDTGLPSGTIPISVTISGWGNIRTSDNMQPYISYGSDNKYGIMSNTNSFLSSATVVVRIAYIQN